VEIRASSSGAGHVEFSLHVCPRARRASVGGERRGALQVRVRAAPVDGALGPRRAEVERIAGARGRRRRGLTAPKGWLRLPPRSLIP